MTSTPSYKIHPAIGIARVGNSPDSFYLAPEVTGAPPIDCGPDGLPIVVNGVEQPVKQYKDASNRIRRQAARFRIFVYDDDSPNGREIKLGDTVSAVQLAGPRKSAQLFTGKLLDILWTVYPANKKSSWYEFQQLEGEHGYSASHPLRNAAVTNPDLRQKLIIDPGPRSVAWVDPTRRTASFAKGTAPGLPECYPPADLTPNPIETLGNLISTTDSDGYNRLLFLGGFGNSGSSQQGFLEPAIHDYANNDGWFDDTSDGPVTATLTIQVTSLNGYPVPPEQNMVQRVPLDTHAWVVTGYPRYAPQIVDMVTMDDLVYDVAVRNSNFAPLIYSKGQYNRDYIVYFWRDIWPILQRPFSYQFVADIDSQDGGDPHQTGPKSGGNFDPGPLSIPPFDGEDPADHQNRAYRRSFIYHVLRKPGRENSLYVDADKPGKILYAMPLLCGDNPLSNDVPSKFLRLTDTMLFLLRQWADGKFLNEKLEDIQPPPLPPGIALDRGVLGNGLGGAFCPGGEVCWILRNPAIYSDPYRIHLAKTVTPGSLSQPAVVSGADTPASIATGLEPGDLTKYSAVPWQADFNECTNQDIDITYENWNLIEASSTGDTFTSKTWLTYWWPAHRPVYVNGSPWSPTPNSHLGDLSMVNIWWELGFVIPTPNSTADTPSFQLSENQIGGRK